MENTRMKHAVDGVEAVIGYKFDDRFLLWEALQAAGSMVCLTGGAGNRKMPNGNKRLAVLGDTVLQLVLVELWYASGQERGTFDQLRQRVGSNTNLNNTGVQARLDTFVERAAGASVVPPVTMTATVEAILGAVYLDSNMESVKKVMQALSLI
ncbi:MAG: hypothetical protein Q9182_000764 [Xanthomendoza sp. 2 TL-2023]